MEPTTIDLAAAFGPVVTSVTSAISDLLPVALPIFGTVLAITIGMKIFKRVTGRA